MRIQIITPFHMQWVDGYNKVFKGHEVRWTKKPVADDSNVMIFMWMNGEAMTYINGAEKTCPWIVFCRRYEMYAVDPLDFNWDKVDKIIFVNDYLAEIFRERTGVTAEVIYNGIDPNNFSHSFILVPSKILVHVFKIFP